ncbi:LANO_0G04896g1_1 [Lachancea nothofagi CBS 11611]|uniref:LANO_0G04896g1_1 n=1 Tax=Lachancea nothofagi CBS 11611 TaxID=1266666 RepID=A0A1G4KGN4_9SACH|nr:LANO_0G04896g1_1 [Lachancea nothofagi CBS 11611]
MELSDDLASAVRKSWSESAPPEGTDSPISTPRGTPKSSTRDSMSAETDFPVDYQLLKHHYAISDDGKKPSLQEGFYDVLGELEFASADVRPQNIRRRSIEEVSKIRQWLNPRSSFSGVSKDEPDVEPYSYAHKCWVTVIESQDDYWPILVLRHSLMMSGSHYKLQVLYSDNTHSIASQLAQSGVEIIKANEISPILMSSASLADQNRLTQLTPSSKWCKLLPFVSLANVYDLVCYLSPRSLVLSNIDELLDSEIVSAEIDNETCVLLSNCMQSPPTVIVLRPNKEIDACIREYMTVYLNAENNGKWAKLQESDGSVVLNELFEELWGIVASEYCYRGSENVPAQAKIVECTTTQPWNATDEISLLWGKAYRQLSQ